MVSHNSTPRSVLLAPKQVFIQAYPNEGRNRQDRRHFRAKQVLGGEIPPLLRFKPMLPPTMTPATILQKQKRTGVKGRRRGK